MAALGVVDGTEHRVGRLRLRAGVGHTRLQLHSGVGWLGMLRPDELDISRVHVVP